MSVRSRHKYVMMIGDFNARTAELRDFTEEDEFLSEMFHFDEETSEIIFPSNIALLKIPVQRKSRDCHTNNHGYKLVDLCKNNNLFILNGLLGNDRQIGQFTFRQVSVIDYTLASGELLQNINKFEIVERSSLFSDGHSLINLSLIFPKRVKDDQAKLPEYKPSKRK